MLKLKDISSKFMDSAEENLSSWQELKEKRLKQGWKEGPTEKQAPVKVEPTRAQLKD